MTQSEYSVEDRKRAEELYLKYKKMLTYEECLEKVAEQKVSFPLKAKWIKQKKLIKFLEVP